MTSERNTLASNEMHITNQTVNNIDIPDGDVTNMYISEVGVATDTTIRDGGVMYISNGGKANYTDITNGGIMHISNGGEASNTAVSSGGEMNIYDGGVASSTTVNSSGYMHITNGGVANSTTINSSGYMHITNGGVTSDTVVSSCGEMNIYDGGVASSTTVNSSGYMHISNGGVANNTTVNSKGLMHITNGGVASSTTVNSSGYMHISNGGVASDTVVSSCGEMNIYDGGVASSVIVKDTGIMKISSGGMLKGSLEIQSGGEVSAEAGAVIDFRVAECETDDYLINDLSLITGTPDYTITVSADQSDGTYKLAQGADNFTGTISIGDDTTQYGLLTVNGGDWVYNNNIYSFEQADGNLTLTIKDYVPGTPIVTNTPESATPVTPGASVGFEEKTDFTVDISVGGKSVNIEKNGKGVAVYAPRTGFEYSVQANGETSSGKAQAVAGDNIQSVLVQAEPDGILDLFMANATDVWSNEYAAKHTGTFGGWQGTGETVELAGKNKITDFFYGGAEDDNILYLTDDSNGDALFVDDVYSALPGKNLENQSRIENLKVIYAGSGDDVVDMTSQRFEYIGSEMTIHGGDGDDVIWATGSDNDLFGDAGDDRIVGSTGFDLIVGGSGNDTMHSGGGNDIFAFCENWGVDTVEITDNTDITLWFASGDDRNWDAENRVYKEGSNSVKVKGGANSTITLKFGDDGGQYADMVSVGAFASSTSEKIFEDKNNGNLA